MYISKNKSELFDLMMIYIGSAPDFSKSKFFVNRDLAKYELIKSIENVFSDSENSRDILISSASEAFLCFGEGRDDDGFKNFKIILDSLV